MPESEESRKEVRVPIKNQILTARNLTNIGTWNVRTLYQAGKLPQLIREFNNYKLQILGISEMRWTGSGRMVSDGKTILFSGHEERHLDVLA